MAYSSVAYIVSSALKELQHVFKDTPILSEIANIAQALPILKFCAVNSHLHYNHLCWNTKPFILALHNKQTHTMEQNTLFFNFGILYFSNTIFYTVYFDIFDI